ncbi:MAG TPA: DUF5668 domain-containing protein [Vicinamibacteria bacterium]|jgi:hypothetical protein
MKRSPSAAVFLSLLPGLGHVYVGQAAKGFLLGLSFVLAIRLADEGSGPFGVFIPFILFYAMVDAHRAAVEWNRRAAAGLPPPGSSDLGLTRWWGYILIGLGVLFTLENFDLFDFDWLWRLWPLALIAIGVYVLRRRAEPEVSAPLPPPPEPATPPTTEEIVQEEEGNA